MPARRNWEDAQVLDRLEDIFARPRLLSIKTEILVHERAPAGSTARCICCGSTDAQIAQRIPDLHLLIDRVTGRRHLRSEVSDPQLFDELAAGAEQLDLPLRCHVDQYDLITATADDFTAILALGGNRSGKTTAGAYWFARQWMLKGGQGVEFWLIGPGYDQAFIALDKLLFGMAAGGRTVPPVFPLSDSGAPALAVKWPTTPRASDLTIYMVDGSRIALKHANNPEANNLKGFNVAAILFDEAAACRYEQAWIVCNARVMEDNGAIYAATTPIPGHWIKHLVVDPYEAGEAPRFLVKSLSVRKNPWISEAKVARIHESLKQKGENAVRREFDGEWVSDRGSLWKHFDVKAHTVDGDGWDVSEYDLGHNVTKRAVRGWWRGRNRFISGVSTKDARFVGGQDFNTAPMTTVICQVYGDPKSDPDTWGLFVIDEVWRWNVTTWQHGMWLRDVRKGRPGTETDPSDRYGPFAGMPIACDSTGAYRDPTKSPINKGSSNAVRELAKLGFDARECMRTPKGKPRNPAVLDRTSLLHKLMRENRLFVHGTRCPKLIQGLTEQEDDGTGRAVKVTRTATDVLSSPVDALAYCVWALFSGEMKRKIRLHP